MKKNVTISFFALLFLLGMSCKKEKPTVPNEVDPCDCAKEVSADFSIEEKLLKQDNGSWLDTIHIESDKVLADRKVRFTASEQGAEYTWYVGAEIITDKSFYRYFSTNEIGFNIPITLVVRKAPNSICFPDDDGYDSITKVMQVVDWCDSIGIEGYFRIAKVGTTDSIDVGIDLYNQFSFEEGCNSLGLYNINGLGVNCVGPVSVSKTYRWFQVLGPSGGGSGTICGKIQNITGRLFLTNVFSLSFDRYDDNWNLIGKEFYKGRKL